ncbi:hypothetical protein LPJ61_000254 [Coemansia biformis]|uniref:Myb-like domain-containing protein n=1 Tax=Coemansia biformis TaxID=1286918 RepID=A0A9W7YH16_9FUNG|nr:hypothetical protein LPJ61_000254 [Coemansia biformis]
MRPDKSYESSAQSTDSEHAGGRSTESASSSSLGGSAAAAARVLAAWQDRTSSSSDDMAAVAAVAAAAAAAGESSALWPTAQPPTALHHSTTPTPRPSQSAALGAQTRESSAPASSSAGAHQRPDMGLLALLNSAAAYVAESTDGPDAALREQERSMAGAYGPHGELLSGSSLTLSSINSGLGQAPASSGDNSRGSYSGAYDAQFSSAAYQDLAQALRHIAATTAGSEHGAPGAVDPMGQPPFDARSFPGGESMDSAVAAAAAAATGVHPDMIMSGSSDSTPHSARMMDVGDAAAAAPKRKRKDGGPPPQPPQAKRKASHSGERGKPGSASDIRRVARKWTEEETDNLLQGCSKYGVGAWKKILDDPNFSFNSRTSVDLKDRFRTIRAQECAQSPHAKVSRKSNGKIPDVVWPLPPNSQRLQGLHRVQRKPTRNYTADEDRRLLIGVLRHANHWTKIAADSDLQLGNRPGQSLRDRLRNAFPEVFELFGYVIPKKERADRERFTTPTSQSSQDRAGSSSKRKAPTGSKRLDGEIPDHIREKILCILHSMNAPLDPRPIPGADGGDDDDGDGDSDMADSCVASPRGASEAPDDDAMDTFVEHGVLDGPHAAGYRSVASRLAGAGSKGVTVQSSGAGAAAGDGSRGRRRASTRGARSASRSGMDGVPRHTPASLGLAGDSAFKLDGRAGLGFAAGASGSGGIHSAPANGASAAEQMAHHRNLLGDFFSPSAFLRQIDTMTPTDQLDALALEGRIASGYSTPTQSSKRRHSIQAHFNDALEAVAAAAAAGGISRSTIAPTLGFFHPGITGLDHAGAGMADSSGLPLNTVETIRRMTVAGPIGADPYLFPRLPDDDASVAAAVAAAANMSVQIGSAQDTAGAVVSDHSAAQTACSEATAAAHTVDSMDAFKISSCSSVDISMPTPAYAHGHDYHTGHRGQFRSAQRLLRANGVADDNSIGLSSASAGDPAVDIEALTQLGEWFPGLGSGGFGWNLAASSGANGSGAAGSGGESIDPNMLDAGLGVAGHEAGLTHARRRSQFDWYGLTPSLAAALEVAGTTAVAAAAHAASVSDTSCLAPLSIGGTAGQPTCRRPSMPVFPSFTYAQSNEMLGIAGALHTDGAHASMTTAEPAVFGGGGQDGAGIAAAAAVAAAAVAVALSDGSESMGIQTADPAAGPGQLHGMRSYSLGTSTAITSSALARVAGLTGVPQRPAPGAMRPRVASTHHGRRRTMHVPPSLVEGVASSEFGDDGGSLAAGPQAHHGGHPYAYPPRPTNAPPRVAGSALPARARRSSAAGRSHGQASADSAAVQSPLPATVAGAETELQHLRAHSGTKLSQDVLGDPVRASDLLAGGGHFDLAAPAPAALQPAAAGGDRTHGCGGSSSGSSVDLGAMAALGAGSGPGIDLSFKSAFWAGGTDESSRPSMHDETRSLVEPRGDLLVGMVDLYRPASATPADSHRRLGLADVGSARSGSPVAPRSAASTPGRHRAVGI